MSVGAERGAVVPSARVGDEDSVRMRSLMELVSLVTASRDYADLLDVMAEESRQALGATAVSLSIWERERGLVRTLVNVGTLAAHQDRHPTDEVYGLADHPLAVRMFTEGAAFVQTLGEEGGDASVDRILARDHLISVLSVPIHLDGRVWGELWAGRAEGHPPYTEDDVAFGRLVATQVGAGIAQAEHVARVERLVYTDDLTGLANRRAFEDHLDIAFGQHRETGVPVGIIVADVNGLKAVNDARGHDAGDLVLTTFASELSAAAAVHAGVLTARLGGDEFCALAVGLPAEQVLALADDICRRAHEELEHGVACGVATTDDLGSAASSPARLLRAADAAQYRAKRSESLVPVVAGRRTPSEPTDPAGPDADRRAFRGRGTREPGVFLDVALARLDEVPDLDSVGRLVVVAKVLAETVDAAGWFVSRVMQSLGTIETVESAVARAGDLGDSSRFFAIDEFPVEEFPASYAAASGQVVVVDVDDPRSDPAETALLMAGGLSEMLMSGGADVGAAAWLVEVVGDELSAPMRPYANVLRAAVAVALHR
ncbi:MAG: GGDEF domain-containing protein [Candidatus Nanopelagicales bacterium]